MVEVVGDREGDRAGRSAARGEVVGRRMRSLCPRTWEVARSRAKQEVAHTALRHLRLRIAGGCRAIVEVTYSEVHCE